MSNQNKHLVGGPLIGAVTDTQAIIKATVQPDITHVSLVLRAAEMPTEGDTWRLPTDVWSDSARDYENNIYSYRVENLLPHTRYFFALVMDGKIDDHLRGTFRTFPPKGNAAGFKFAFGSCSKDRDAPIFEAIGQEDFLFFFHLGDFHYTNPKSKPLFKRLNDFDNTLHETGQGEFLKKMPLAYTWDDHDFINNDTGGEGNEKSAKRAFQAYDIYFPHYDFADPEHCIFQSFVVGKVLFILTDLRFNQSLSDKAPQDGEKRVFGESQLNWIEDKLEEGKDMDLVVITSSFPFIARDLERRGDWVFFPEERERFAQIVKDKNVRNLCMISGDAHMLAIDDGSNSGFANGGTSGGFPVFHAASLSSSTGSKGGPYSKGSAQNGGSLGFGIEGKNQYGFFEITYKDENGADLAEPEVVWKGRRVDESGQSRDLISHRFKARRTFAGF